ncbi:LacI family DNA-binding transcriptional regulator [Kribbella sandramycini]|uniref:LacI family DNA-binding transcriptional regulator n=1 Tax=Kribbella sandramycini TaxID=60450 RepID=A0A7Y4KW27_9ACTN|nr:LacI family DNA-binding transcriptional regulator [Kribbella sandramycini]MBB6567696.1 LacI family transcriptional regulator [Kribbella sandramycini]NOL39703.1 LacI family DNA-binding transcriptional regulator [Kribbella sandramycini]
MPNHVRIRDVAERAGVSVSLVSTYLNSPDKVGERSSAKIQRAIDDLQFVPNEAARQLRNGVSRMVAFVAFDIGDPFFTAVARGAQQRAAEAGLRLVLAETRGDQQTETEYVALFKEQRVRGVLLAPAHDPASYLTGLRRYGIEAVLIDHAPAPGWPAVVVGNRAGGRLAVEHLLDQGCTRIAVAGGTLDIPQVVDRRRGAADSVADRSDVLLMSYDSTTRDVSAGREIGHRLLASAVRPDGVFCVNDSVAAGVRETLVAAATDIPGDIAIIGYNDIATEAAGFETLSSIRVPDEHLGSTAVDLLLKSLDHPGFADQVEFTPELIIRASSRRTL